MLLTGQPFTEALSVDEPAIAFGQYILGNLNGYVILRNLAIGDTAEVRTGQILYNNVIAFDENWSRVTNKTYNFSLICAEDIVRLKRILYEDHALITRLLCKSEPSDRPLDWVEYGFIDPETTQLSHFKSHVQLTLGFISVFEVANRKQLVCP